MNRPLYDKSINYDISNLPVNVKEIIKNLEKASEVNDFITYNAEFSLLESQLKSLIIAGRLSERDFKILGRKYGWYCD